MGDYAVGDTGKMANNDLPDPREPDGWGSYVFVYP